MSDDSSSTEPTPDKSPAKKRRRGSRGGRGRTRAQAPRPVDPEELPERIGEGRPSAESAAEALVPRPKIGDTRPAPRPSVTMPGGQRAGASRSEGSGRAESAPKSDGAKKRRRRGGRGRKIGRAHV